MKCFLWSIFHEVGGISVSGGCDRISMECYASSYSRLPWLHWTCGLPSGVSKMIGFILPPAPLFYWSDNLCSTKLQFLLTHYYFYLQVFSCFNFTIFLGHWLCVKDIRQHHETVSAILLEHWEPREQPKYIWTGSYNRGIYTNFYSFEWYTLSVLLKLQGLEASESCEPIIFVPSFLF